MSRSTHPRRVMISSTSLDLPEHRAEVVAACLGQDLLPIDMKYLPARDITAREVDEEMVNKADVYIGIYAHRYGTIAEGEEKSYTELEFDHAVSRGLDCLIFLMGRAHPLHIDQVEIDPEAQKKLAAFKLRASSGRICKEFNSAKDLHAQVIAALAQWKQERQLEEKPGIDVPPPRPDDKGASEEATTEKFLAVVASMLGLIALIWQFQALAAVSKREIMWMPLWGNAYPSGIILGTLFILGTLLIILHVVMHAHQRFGGTDRFAKWFPGSLHTLQIPKRLAWMRIVAFVFLVAAPTGTQVFWVGRLFDHMEIVWKADENVVLKGAKLLTFPEPPDHSPKGIFDSDWRWRYWYDEVAALAVLPPEQRSQAKKLTRYSVFPGAGLQPWLYLLEGVGLTLSLSVLAFKAGRSQKRKK